MPQQPNFHEHIEQAIQNVLSKVKTPERAPAQIKPSAVRPATRREAVTGPLLSVAETTENLPVPAASSEIRSPDPAVDDVSAVELPAEIVIENEEMASEAGSDAGSEAASATVGKTLEPIYLQAEDLYTPLREEDLHPESDEPPLQEDTYSPPYNLFEEFVETELNILLQRYLDLCRCSQCRADIVALALHQLPAYYVTGTRGTLTAKSVIWTRYMQQIMDAVSTAIHIVYKRPRPNCGKIRQMLWVKPELEVVTAALPEPEGEFFGAIHQEDVEIKFSDEVAELIQTLELASAHDKTELLPVFSPVVQNAYKQYAVSEELPPDDLQLLDIDSWDS